MKFNVTGLLTGVLALFLMATPIQAQQMSPQEMEDWLFDDRDSLATEVNEGELVFLENPPDGKVHHHANQLIINDESIDSGWVKLIQCHTNLDRVGLAQILFRKDRVRKLRVTEARNIDRAWVNGASIQLENIHEGARLCIGAETRSFVYNGDGSFSLRSGPYMRRFLDGYYPMRVSLDVQVNTNKLRFADITPNDRKGFKVWKGNNSIHYDAWFEGKLSTEIRFYSEVIVGNAGKAGSRGMIANLDK